MEKKLKVRIESLYSGKVQNFETNSLIVTAREGESFGEEHIRCYVMGQMSKDDMAVLLASIINSFENQIGIDHLDVVAKALTLAIAHSSTSNMEDILNGKNY